MLADLLGDVAMVREWVMAFRHRDEGLEDGAVDPALAPIPSLLLCGAVHHHLIRERTRTRVGLVVECADAREAHHIALLTGYGAALVNPYLALESVQDMVRRGVLENVSADKAPATSSRRSARAC